MTIIPLLAIVALLGITSYAATRLVKTWLGPRRKLGRRLRLLTAATPVVAGLVLGLVVEACGGLTALVCLCGDGVVGLALGALLGLAGGTLATQLHCAARAWVGRAGVELPVTIPSTVTREPLDTSFCGEERPE